MALFTKRQFCSTIINKMAVVDEHFFISYLNIINPDSTTLDTAACIAVTFYKLGLYQQPQ